MVFHALSNGAIVESIQPLKKFHWTTYFRVMFGRVDKWSKGSHSRISNYGKRSLTTLTTNPALLWQNPDKNGHGIKVFRVLTFVQMNLYVQKRI